MDKDTEFCTCKDVKNVTTKTDGFGNQWDVCMECRKPIEDSYEQNPLIDDFE